MVTTILVAQGRRLWLTPQLGLPGRAGRPREPWAGSAYGCGHGRFCARCTGSTTQSRERERLNAARRKPPSRLRCVECGEEFEGQKGWLLCGERRCKDRRYARLHPEKLAAKQHRKYERRKAT